ncbi:MAG: acetate--CoA ligase [Anaerolineae bacterium]|nr:acetate--CoA ligase [Anaerolineae bacterium]MCX8067724.1 acetate--CoA ligase [Anaerolineae bacterium]MDW7991304.1 acetate--CoA ligase [Anaerolineae bacterium]
MDTERSTPLEFFFRPSSVAVIGASRDPEKLGYAVLANLKNGGFPGDLYPVNPKADEILGLRAYPTVLDIPGPVDLAVIVIPYALVPAALEQCGQKGVPAVVVISAGFREAGREGLEREMELIQIARRYGIRLIGPNCLGVIDTDTPLNATFAAGMPPGGPIAFMSQSGALGTAVLDMALAGRIGFSRFVSLGNKADVNEVDLLEAWEDDPGSRVILAYIEGLPDGQKFMEVARRVTRKKPVVAVKSGVTRSGARAVSSHTGSLAGSEAAYHAAFRQAGVIRAESMEHLFDLALAFAYQPLPKGDRIAIVTNAGGPGILATDALEHAGLQLARFRPETVEALMADLPSAASAANPVDVLGDALADRYEHALRLVLADPGVDGVIVIVTPQAMTQIEETAHVVGRVARETDKPILGCFMGESRIAAGVAILQQYGIPNYPFPERAAAALAAMVRYRQERERPFYTPRQYEVDRAAVRKVLDEARAQGRVSIGDAEARTILEAYGFPLPPSRLATTPEEAVAAAEEMGYPVVLKIASPDILHKTDVGGVRLNLRSPTDVRDAFDLIVYRAARYVPGARIWGCLVQKMVPPGREVLIGMSRDPQFGPLVAFGLGGIYVEALKDVVFRVAPFGPEEAAEMVREIRSYPLLEGIRGQPPADVEAIVDALCRVSQLVTDFPEIAELDINPLMVFEEGKGAVALDMRLILG